MDLHEQGMSSRTFVIAAIVCVLLQAGLAPQISIAGGRVNFMIILVCLSVFSGDPTRAVACGFCSRAGGRYVTPADRGFFCPGAQRRRSDGRYPECARRHCGRLRARH